MLEMEHRLVRQTINIAVSKAMEDMKSNTRRSIRNLIDLGLLFSNGENQEWFFNTAKKIAANPGNPYNALVARMVSNVNNDAIKKVGLNLGYSSLIYGAGKLRKKRDSFGLPLPWLLIFDISDPGPDYFHQMGQLIKEGRELGIYTYIACPQNKGDIPAVCDIAKSFEECLFILKVSAALISEKTAEALGKIHNAVVSVQSDGPDFDRGDIGEAHRLLRKNRCLYGYHVRYNEDTAKLVTAPEYIGAAIGTGSLFGVYIAEEGVPEACRDAVYDFACHTRGERGRPLLTFEWQRDIQNINQKIFSDGGSLPANLTQWLYGAYIRAKDVLTKPLLEILRGMRPCGAD
ncbi:hypothetical protein SAMN02745823_01835 [Sporobacter termitidis DSM 10068]|uniref:Uncharacterized protein n=1 Tax=Sporobacter termitidis DSM 10068 TaxID=1123282 RepID=A0A1M5XIN7_9FIRM|nr:hypothetical protein [Sporobacter termitidis]SHH99418.1 hypothetical protein SAMN02745823_01835 [Sporobacter termitidis DSM 10068]